MYKKIAVLVPLAIVFAIANSASAFASYHIEAAGAEARSEKTEFKIGEVGSFTCAKVVFEQPNKTEKELTTEDQSLITTFSECSGKLGAVPVDVTITPEADFVIGAGKEISETTFADIPLSIEEELVIRATAEGEECTIRAPAELNKELIGVQWRNVDTVPGSYASEFTIGVSGEGEVGGEPGCASMLLTGRIPWRWVLSKWATQGGETS